MIERLPHREMNSRRMSSSASLPRRSAASFILMKSSATETKLFARLRCSASSLRCSCSRGSMPLAISSCHSRALVRACSRLISPYLLISRLAELPLLAPGYRAT